MIIKIKLPKKMKIITNVIWKVVRKFNCIQCWETKSEKKKLMKSTDKRKKRYNYANNLKKKQFHFRKDLNNAMIRMIKNNRKL